jgi:GDP-L-fucose synthase
MEPGALVFVAGDHTLIGSAVVRALEVRGFTRVDGDGRSGVDLRDPSSVAQYFRDRRPRYVIHAAGRTGGIEANRTQGADLMLDNLLVNTHVLRSAHDAGVEKLLYLASSCSYPRLCPQPMTEDSLFTGPLEPTNEPYALAKLAGLGLCQAYHRQYGDRFFVGIPANAYGPEDDFDPEAGHVIPALIRRMHEAKVQNAAEVVIWGTGSARREFMDVDDLASACLFVLEKRQDIMPINLGGGEDVSIRDLAVRIQQVTKFEGRLVFDAEKPDGMPLKALDSRRLKAMGWRPSVSLDQGLMKTYHWFLEHGYGQGTGRTAA